MTNKLLYLYNVKDNPVYKASVNADPGRRVNVCSITSASNKVVSAIETLVI